MTTFNLNTEDTPPALRARIIGAIPGVNSTCRLRVLDLEGTEVITERAVTDTVVVSNITYFDVKLTIAESALLAKGQYVWAVQLESTSLDFKQEFVHNLNVSEQYVLG